jgi:two-component system LytT family sensor kinase
MLRTRRLQAARRVRKRSDLPFVVHSAPNSEEGNIPLANALSLRPQLSGTNIHNIPAAGTPFIPVGFRNPALLRHRWLYHLLFWLLYYALTIILYANLHTPLTPHFFIFMLIMTGIQAAFAYFNLYVLIPRLLFARKYTIYIPVIFVVIVTCSSVILLTEQSFDIIIEGRAAKTLKILTFSNLCIRFVQDVYLFGLVTCIKFLKDSILNRQLQEEKEKQYLETELKFLKSQIQPHFFFNTLNNIYSLTLKKSDEAPEVVLRLSDLMSYMLYDSTAPVVPLNSEIGYLRNYLDIERLRFGPRLTATFTIEGPTDSANIPPMILILFLENSFKHGVRNNISQILLSLNLKVSEGNLHFRVENPVPEEKTPEVNNGIGLKNVRRRLDLLYGDSYTLETREEDRKYIVSLKMPLC